MLLDIQLHVNVRLTLVLIYHMGWITMYSNTAPMLNALINGFHCAIIGTICGTREDACGAFLYFFSLLNATLIVHKMSSRVHEKHNFLFACYQRVYKEVNYYIKNEK